MPDLSYLTIDHAPNKTTYLVGDRFERYGMIVKAHYSDGSSNAIDFYMCSPSNPLTINDTQITISFMDKSVTQNITVINPPSTGYFINKCLDKANYGNNPYVNTVDGSISFYNSPITIERDSYQLNVILSYHSRMTDKESDLIKGFYKGFRTNYHQFLIKDGLDNDNNDIYKYIDGNGYVHTFLYNDETNLYHDKEGRYLILNITDRTITDSKNNIYTFDTSGRLISIKSGLNPQDIKVIEYNSDGIRKIYDNRNPNVYIKFSYNFSFLVYIRAYYNDDNNPLKTYTFNGLFGQITSITESVGNNTRTLYEYLYNDREKVRRIVDHLNNVAYRLTYDFDTILNDYRFNSIRQGYMSNDSLIEQKGIYFVRRNANITDAYKPIYELVIKDDNDIDTSFMSDTNGEPVSVFESVHNQTNSYKTLSKEIGKRLSFQNNASTYGTINGKKAKPFSSVLTINEGLSSTDLDSSEHVKLCGYIKIRADVQRAKLWLDGTNISTEYIDLNPTAYYAWQYFEIPFIRTKSNNIPLAFSSFNLETRDGEDENFDASICNLRFVKCEPKQRLFFINAYNNDFPCFDELRYIKLSKSNNTYETLNILYFSIFMSEQDLLNTYKRKYSHGDNPYIAYFNNGKIIKTYYSDIQGIDYHNREVSLLGTSLVNNDPLGTNKNWFFAISEEALIKTYYRFNQGNYEVIIRTKTSNSPETYETVTSRYNYQDQILFEINKYGSTTHYQYFADGQLKKKYVEYVDTNNVSRTSILYEASLDENNKFIERKSQEYQSYDYVYSKYLVSKKKTDVYYNGDYSVSSFSTNYYNDDFLDNLSGVEFRDDDYLIGKHNSSFSNNNMVLSVDDTRVFYQIVTSQNSQNATIQIKDENNYIDIVSIITTNQTRQIIYNTSFNNVPSTQIYLEEYNEHHQITCLKIDGDTNVTYIYEQNVIESSASANLTNVVDGFIDETFDFYYDSFNKLTSIVLGSYYCEYGVSSTIIKFGQTELYEFKSTDNVSKVLVDNNEIHETYVKYEFDNLERIYRKKRKNLLGLSFYETFAYSSLFPSYVNSYDFGSVYHEDYQYDVTGNLSRIAITYDNSSSLISYTYDYFGRIMSEYNTVLNISRSYGYDNTGRMVLFGNVSIQYDDRGRIISFGNNTYQYDEYGNRRIKNLTFNYQYTRGNLLLVAGFNSFTYDYLGRRYSKNGADGIIHRYYYDGTKLVGEDRSDGIKLRFFYDKTGLCGFRYISPNSQSVDFQYIKNPFNDIVGIASGTTILVRYLYDAWGNHQIIDNSNTNIGTINPFRYKSYYYDGETNLYYLNSRYYDPEIGQFISPNTVDNLDFESISGTNLYVSYLRNYGLGVLKTYSINKSSPISNNSLFGTNSFKSSVGFSFFGVEHKTSLGWEDTPKLFDNGFLRIGESFYETSVVGEGSVLYVYTGSFVDSFNFMGSNLYAGMGIHLGFMEAEAQYELLGIAASTKIGRFSVALEINLFGTTGITFGFEVEKKSGLSTTKAITIGVNTKAIILVAALILGIFGLGPSGQTSQEYANG